MPTPQRLAADAEDAFALKANPAGLAFVRGAELRAALGFDTTLPGDNPYVAWGAFGVLNFQERLSLALGAEQTRIPNADEFSFKVGGAVPFGVLGFGFDYERFDPFSGPAQDLFNFGVSLRPLSWLAAGARFGDVTENLGPRNYGLSLSLRPFSDRIQLSGQWNIDAEPEFLGRLQVEPLNGIVLGVGISSEETYFTQLEVQLHGSHGIGFVANPSRDGVGASVVVSSVFPSRTRALWKADKVAVFALRGSLQQTNSQYAGLSVYADRSVAGTLEALYQDVQITGLFLRIGTIEAGWAQVEEVHRLIERFRSDGRSVGCYLDAGSDLGYYLATACSKILIAPSMILRLDGLASESLYFGEALQRFGLRFEVERIGRYKTSPDQYTEAQRSEAEREQVSAYLDGLYTRVVHATSQSRGLPLDRVRTLIDGGVMSSTAALTSGLVDEILYPDEVDAYLKEVYRTQVVYAPPSFHLVRGDPSPWGVKPRIALVSITGPIGARSPPLNGGSGGQQSWIQDLERAKRDPLTQAVVLRINSPGGDAYLSDLIARKVQRLARDKPVIASLGDVAASGGYYIAAPSTKIVAEPTTLTGSIGIYSIKLDASQMLKRFGVGIDVIQRGERAADRSPWVSRPDEGDRALKAALASSYAQFLKVVSEGRRLPVEQVEAAAAGRIYSGQAALEMKLVDRLGGVTEALAWAAELSGGTLSDFEVIRPQQQIPEASSILDVLGETGLLADMGLASEDLLASWTGALATWKSRLPLLLSNRPLALMPWVVRPR